MLGRKSSNGWKKSDRFFQPLENIDLNPQKGVFFRPE